MDEGKIIGLIEIYIGIRNINYISKQTILVEVVVGMNGGYATHRHLGYVNSDQNFYNK